MSQPVHTPDLDLPASVPSPDRLPAPETLSQAGAARDGVCELSGRRAQLLLNPRTGIAAFFGDGVEGCRGWRWLDAVGATIVRSPRMARRELMSPQGTLLETTLVPDGLPGMIVQIERIAGPADAPPQPMILELPSLPDSAGWRFNRGPGCLTLSDGGRRISMRASCEDLVPEWHLTDHGVEARFDVPLPVGEPVTFLLMLDAEGERGASMAALGALPAHFKRAEIDAEGRGHAGLRVETGIAHFDDGFGWIRARLRDRLRRPTGGGEDVLHLAPSSGDSAPDPWLVRGALATGDWAVARAALVQLEPSPGMLVAWARWVGWTGQGGLMLANRPAIEAALNALGDCPPFTADRLRKAVADAAEAAGDEGWAAELRMPTESAGTDGNPDPKGAAGMSQDDDEASPAEEENRAKEQDRKAPEGSEARRRLTLPMVGGSAEPASPPSNDDSHGSPEPSGHNGSGRLPTMDDLRLAAELALPLPVDEALRAVKPALPSSPLAGPGSGAGAAHGAGTGTPVGSGSALTIDATGVQAAIESLRMWSLGRADEGYPGFRQTLGVWGEHAPGDESSAGPIAAAFVEGMLGARPDAAFGRLRLAPSFPSSWTGVRIDGITVEKMRLGMTYRRSGDSHSFIFTPEAGSVPGMLIFEPRLSGASLREVRIDGQVAEVGSERIGDRIQIQVQLPADAERRIEIDVEPITSR